MSDHQRIYKDQSQKLGRMSNALELQRKILERILRAIEDQTKEFSEDLTGLNETMGNVRTDLRKLTDVTIDIEEVKAVAARDTKRTLLEHASSIWSRAKDRFANQYSRIINDYVRGLVENVERFCRLVADELAPLFRIKNATIDYQSIASDMQPKVDDELRLEAAMAMSGSRGSQLDNEYGAARRNLTAFVQERKDLVEKIEATRMPSDSLKMESLEPGEIVLFSIPMYLVKLEGPDENQKVVRIPASRIKPGSKNPHFSERLIPMCPELHSATMNSPRFSHEQMLADVENNSLAISTDKRTLENVMEHLNAAGASSMFRGAVKMFYGKKSEHWNPDKRTAEPIETLSDEMTTQGVE